MDNVSQTTPRSLSGSPVTISCGKISPSLNFPARADYKTSPYLGEGRENRGAGNAAPTCPWAAVELESKTDGSRAVAMRNETNLARDNGRVNIAQLAGVRVDVARENLQQQLTTCRHSAGFHM